MKNLINAMILSGACLFFSCNEKESTGRKPDSIDREKVYVTSMKGGAFISYSIPDDPDILYVMAEYMRNGKVFTERSSVYNNSIIVEGFNTTDPVRVSLYTVNRQGVKSDPPINIQFVPLESPISLTFKSLVLETGFGGIVVSWENEAKTELGFRLMFEKDGVLIDKEMYFSALARERYPFRGFTDTVMTVFALSVEDKWGNVSDTIFYSAKPYYEIEVAKPFIDMRMLVSGDNVSSYGTAYPFSKLYDGFIGDNGYLTGSGNSGNSFTIDLKQVVKLSRMIFWPRVRSNSPVADVYGNVNITKFEMWGSAAFDVAKPPSYWADLDDPSGTFKEEWEYLGYYERERLDLQGAGENDIQSRGQTGDYFDIPLTVGPVRYIRFFARATAGGSPPPNNYYQLSELSFFGDNTVSQY
ncbi:MAG: DUF4959 domain-containing protein [Dysgonamonadaceae bacterium]|jgi:hypothetical protein|nr:DUF4959 domain-containing protein [Dysgonamonadaceae bacterium]